MGNAVALSVNSTAFLSGVPETENALTGQAERLNNAGVQYSRSSHQSAGTKKDYLKLPMKGRLLACPTVRCRRTPSTISRYTRNSEKQAIRKFYLWLNRQNLGGKIGPIVSGCPTTTNAPNLRFPPLYNGEPTPVFVRGSRSALAISKLPPFWYRDSLKCPRYPKITKCGVFLGVSVF